MENQAWHSRQYISKFVNVDPDRCIGCGICELICSFEKTKDFDPQKSRIRVVRLYPAINVAVSCRLCVQPACVRVCPKNALSQSGINSVILVDENRCDGCGLCIQACNYGSIMVDSQRKVAYTCDLCKERRGIGVFPGRKISNQACIEWCPEEALNLVTGERIAQKSREKVVAKLLVADQEA